MSFSGEIRLARRWVAGVVVALAGLVSVAQAQFGEAAGIGEAMQPDYFKRDLTTMAQELKLDNAQRVIVDALYSDYETAFNEGLSRTKQKLDNMRNELDPTDIERVLRHVFAPFKEWAPEKEQLGERFLEDVKMVLSQEQLERWPTLVRRLYRERSLHKGRLAGETVDLFIVLREMQLDERTTIQIQPLVEAYDIALDQALRRRAGSSENMRSDMLDSMSEQDTHKSMIVMQRLITHQIAVRNVNDEFIERIAAALPEDLGAQFRQAALERGYPRIYRETPVQRIFKEARKIEGLDAGIAQSLAQLEASYLGELASANQQLRSAIQETEPAQAMAQAESFHRRMKGEQVDGPADATRDLYAQRDEMARRYAKQLQALLTPEQFAQLPGAMRWTESPEQQGQRPRPVLDSPKNKVKDQLDENVPVLPGTGNSPD